MLATYLLLFCAIEESAFSYCSGADVVVRICKANFVPTSTECIPVSMPLGLGFNVHTHGNRSSDTQSSVACCPLITLK